MTVMLTGMEGMVKTLVIVIVTVMVRIMGTSAWRRRWLQ